ncbi:MAG: M20 metallopeptidase family protein [Bacteroidota bacterium]
MTEEKIRSAAKSILDELVHIRRHLHQHPELSFAEYKTAEYISKKLTEWGIAHTTGVAGTGLTGILEGKSTEGKIIALRADIDALPIHEENTTSYCSQNEGVMHACGHDVHTTCLLGALKILKELKNEWDGKVKFIFQPGEEKLPGGASLMIKEGVLENPQPGFILGQHVFPELETGKVGFRSGMYMASTDEIYITVTGKGGHAALPKQYNNPLLIASSLLLELDDLLMKNKAGKVPATIPTVLAFGKIEGKGATNVIPANVEMAGTFRTMNEEWRAKAHQLIHNTAKSVSEKTNSAVTVRIEKGYPFLVNDERVTNQMKTVAEKYLGKENVVELDVRMTAEDFAWYSQVIPACFYRLGTRNEAKGIVSPVHSATFDIDERALEIGAGLMAAGVML